jgi:hypothetical protein
MKKLLLLFSLLFSFSYGFSQHAVNVKKTASAMLQADEQKDYNNYVSYFYPSELKLRGGKAKFIQQIQTMKDKQSQLALAQESKRLGRYQKSIKPAKSYIVQ